MVQVATAVIACFAGGLVQGALGFGLSLIGVPLMLATLDVRTAVVIGFLHGCTTSAWLMFRLWSYIDIGRATLLCFGAIIGMPIGALVLRKADPGFLAVAVGVLCLVAGVSSVRLARGALARSRLKTLSRSGLWACGVVSGLLNTSTSTNGPPLVWALRRCGVTPIQFKATISATFTISNLVGLLLLHGFGLVEWRDAILFAASTPGVGAGLIVGARISRAQKSSSFFTAVDVLLLFAGALALGRGIL